jgi:sulfur carrier protein
MAETIQIQLNGEPASIPVQSSVQDVLKSLQFPSDRVAVVINGEIIRKADHGQRMILSGDTVDIITMVGGG